MNVYIVQMGERYEGGRVSSVHATMDAAIAAVHEYLEASEYMRDGWNCRETPSGGKNWTRGIDWITAERYPVL